VGVQRLRTTEDAGEGLDSGASDVDLGLLRGERHTRSLRVETELQRALGLRAVTVAHPSCPDAPRRTVLGDLLEEVEMGIEEERQPGRERVDGEYCRECELDIGEPVRKR